MNYFKSKKSNNWQSSPDKKLGLLTEDENESLESLRINFEKKFEGNMSKYNIDLDKAENKRKSRK